MGGLVNLRSTRPYDVVGGGTKSSPVTGRAGLRDLGALELPTITTERKGKSTRLH